MLLQEGIWMEKSQGERAEFPEKRRFCEKNDGFGANQSMCQDLCSTRQNRKANKCLFHQKPDCPVPLQPQTSTERWRKSLRHPLPSLAAPGSITGFLWGLFVP